MTTEQYQTRQDELDEQDDRAMTIIIALGCVVITLSWMALLAHWMNLI